MGRPLRKKDYDCVWAVSIRIIRTRFGLGTHVYVLYVARLLGGISAAFIMPAVTAYVADITTVQERSKAMGYVSAAISTGFIIGPELAGLLQNTAYACHSSLRQGLRLLPLFRLCLC